jgi:hypothetical protein
LAIVDVNQGRNAIKQPVIIATDLFQIGGPRVFGIDLPSDVENRFFVELASHSCPRSRGVV